MRPEQKSKTLLAITRSKAKMIEYGVPEKYQQISLQTDPAKLFTLSIGILGDLSARTSANDIPVKQLSDMRQELHFSAHFFDAYLQSRLNEKLDAYLILLGSASYYLCDLPGSSNVLAKQIGDDCPDLEGEGLEDLLLWILKSDLSTYFKGSEGPFGRYVDSISRSLIQFFKRGTGIKDLFDITDHLRQTVYAIGSPRQLLLGDVISSVIRKKYQNSSWNSLPNYSGLSSDQWLPVLQKETFIKELWPAQHLLGEAGVLKGLSAVVQMPTSAGKTKATELVIRSAFLADRTSLAVIIAPYRALCHEIKNSLVSAFQIESVKVDELSDVIQTDFDVATLLSNKQILIVTPEKLLYVLRHVPELATSVGLVIFDEGHQFDSGTRGITYELLLTSLRAMLPKGAQKLLISAVISNAQAVGEWLNGAESQIIAGTKLTPTFRTVGFASWLEQLGQIKYVSNEDPDKEELFVPRVIESYKLKKKGKETKLRIFPDKSSEHDVGKEIALLLGLKLVSGGSVALFCGRKSTAATICEKALDIVERGIPLRLPRDFSNLQEIQKLYYLHKQNLGAEAAPTKSAQLGIFSHHGNTPHGLRLSVEHAMREELIRFVVCTSTLAQGVNLPIRYLIVTSVYQGLEQIKVRDFHNLIGRAGRAGMHTEGSILFADPVVYDRRFNWKDKWRWELVKNLLDPSKSEECISSLFQLIPLTIRNDRNKALDKKDHTLTWDILSFAQAYIGGPADLNRVVSQIVRDYGKDGFTAEKTTSQLEYFGQTLAFIESFLLSNWDAQGRAMTEADIINLAEETLACFLADEEKRKQILDLFKLLGENIKKNIIEPNRRKIYGRTLYGMIGAQEIDGWVQNNINQLISAGTDAEILNTVWSLLAKNVHGSTFKKCDSPAVLKEVAQEWIKGTPFSGLFSTLQMGKAKLIWGTKRREYTIDNIIEISEGGLSYDGALLIGAVIECIDLSDHEHNDKLISKLQLFQKKLKYGLPSERSIALYEMGFSDRVVSQDLEKLINVKLEIKKTRQKLKEMKSEVRKLLEKYPIYFSSVIFDSIVR